MSDRFPELNSFGTLLRFAGALEEAAARLSAEAAGRDDCSAWKVALTACGRKHGKRVKRLERIRQERLNEVVLQPLEGMEREDYLPPETLPSDPGEAVAVVAGLEETTARFYRDAASTAADVLTGVDKTFKKFAKESEKLKADLG